MPIAPGLLDAINEAIDSTPWYIPNAPVLYVTGRREIVGFYGKRVKGDAAKPIAGEDWLDVVPVTHPEQTYSFTRSQCKRIRNALRAEARRLVSH